MSSLYRGGNEEFERLGHCPKVAGTVVGSAFELLVNLMQSLCCTGSLCLNRL